MNDNTKDVFSEVYSILHLYGEEYIRKLPPKLYLAIENGRNPEYNPTYQEADNLMDYHLKRDTVALLVLLYLNYWYESEEQKKEVQTTLDLNTEKQHQKMRERYSSQNLFKGINEAREKQRIEQDELRQVAEKIEEEVQKEEPQKEGFFNKLFHK